jgi:hypothetical protein
LIARVRVRGSHALQLDASEPDGMPYAERSAGAGGERAEELLGSKSRPSPSR